MKQIDDILNAYFSGKIDFIVPRYEDGEPNFYGEFEIIINDNTYQENGNELLIMKWVEDFECTDYLIECME